MNESVLRVMSATIDSEALDYKAAIDAGSPELSNTSYGALMALRGVAMNITIFSPSDMATAVYEQASKAINDCIYYQPANTQKP